MTGSDTAYLATDMLGPALRLTLRMPALVPDVITGLQSALDGAAGAPAVILASQADAFCLGMDFDSAISVAQSGGTRALNTAFSRLLADLHDFPGFTIAVVEGNALGGGLALAAACDFVIATPEARFGLPEAVWGVLPSIAAEHVARRAGLAATRRLALKAEPIGAEEALRLGLVDQIVADKPALDAAIRRHALRARNIGSGTVHGVKTLFDRLETAPETYAEWAIDDITRRMDDPATHQRLATPPGQSKERPV